LGKNEITYIIATKILSIEIEECIKRNKEKKNKEVKKYNIDNYSTMSYIKRIINMRRLL